MRKIIQSDLNEAVEAYKELAKSELIEAQVLELARDCADSLESGGIIFFAGNGGSFADAQHMAAEFSGKLSRARSPLASIALGTNNSSLSAIGNDFGFSLVFARELEAYKRPNSIVIAFSTSGNSENLVQLAESAESLGINFWAITGRRSGKLERFKTIKVPSERTERIQEMHTTLGHILCFLIEEELGIFSES